MAEDSKAPHQPSPQQNDSDAGLASLLYSSLLGWNRRLGVESIKNDRRDPLKEEESYIFRPLDHGSLFWFQTALDCESFHPTARTCRSELWTFLLVQPEDQCCFAKKGNSTLCTEPIENEKNEAKQENGIPTYHARIQTRTNQTVARFQFRYGPIIKITSQSSRGRYHFISQHYSRGQGSSSYTRLWTAATWQQHSDPRPHERYWKHLVKWRHSVTASRILPTIGITVAWSTFMVVLLDHQSRVE